MYCRNCGAQLDEKASYCTSCGCKPKTGKKYCQNCGEETNENQVVCIKCGSKLAAPDSLDLGGTGKTKLVAALLCFFLGTLGIHDFYLGYKKNGIIKIVLTCVGFVTFGIGAAASAIWSLVDLVQILTGSKNDADGNPLD